MLYGKGCCWRRDDECCMEGRRGDECFIGGGVVREGVMTVAWEGVESEKVCRSEKYCMV